MKNTFLLLFLVVLFYGCEKDQDGSDTPLIKTGMATEIATNFAWVDFSIYNIGNFIENGIVWDTKLPISSNNTESVDVWEGDHRICLTSLPRGAVIYYCAYAKNSKGRWVYGETMKFKTWKYSKVTLKTGMPEYRGQTNDGSNRQMNTISASLVGLPEVTSWGVIASYVEKFSYTNNYAGRFLFEKSGYTEGTYISIDVENTASGERRRLYSKAFAVLYDGEIVYGDVKSVY